MKFKNEENNEVIELKSKGLIGRRNDSLQDLGARQERILEERYISLFAVNQSDICKCGNGKVINSMTKMTTKFKDWLVEEGINDYYKLQKLDYIKELFAGFIFNIKYNEDTSYHKKQRKEWKNRFEDNSINKDIERVLVWKIYQMKAERERKCELGFVSIEAKLQAGRVMLSRDQRKIGYEIAGRTVKNLSEVDNIPKLDSEFRDALGEEITRVFKETINQIIGQSGLSQSDPLLLLEDSE